MTQALTTPVQQENERRLYSRGYVAAIATATRSGKKRVSYLVSNLSASGALLTDGPPLHAGERLQMEFEIAGHAPLHVNTIVVRDQHSNNGAEQAITFCDLSEQQQRLINCEVERALTRHGEPVVLVLGTNLPLLSKLATNLSQTGRRAVLASSSLQAVRWLCDLECPVDTLLVQHPFCGAQGLRLLSAVQHEFPTVYRVLVCDQLHRAELDSLSKEHMVDAAIVKPWTPEALDYVIGSRAVSH